MTAQAMASMGVPAIEPQLDPASLVIFIAVVAFIIVELWITWRK